MVCEYNTLPLLEFMIPTYNEESTVIHVIGRLLALLDSDERRVLVTVSDNASQDGTVSALRAAFGADRRVRIFEQERNMGSRNNFYFLLESAVGDYVSFVGAHDRFSSNFAPMALDKITQFPSADYCMFATEFDEFEGSPVTLADRQLRLHACDRIRYWQLVLFLSRGTLVHAAYPRLALQRERVLSAQSFAFDHVFIHAGLSAARLVRLRDASFVRFTKKTAGPKFAYANSTGEVESRAQRVLGASGVKLTDRHLPGEIVNQRPSSCNAIEAWVSRRVLEGKYEASGFKFFVFRLMRRLMALTALNPEQRVSK